MRLRIEGGQPLSGEFRPAGNSNAAVALLAASLLSSESVTLSGLPRATGALAMLETAAEIGAELEWYEGRPGSSRNGAIIARVRGGARLAPLLPRSAHARYAGNLLLLAPMLCAAPADEQVRVELDYPLRRIRVHLAALRELGLVESAQGAELALRRRCWQERALMLAEPSVTATALIMMLAARLGGETTIENAACEPHIQELGRLLQQMGARIAGLGANRLRIQGQPELGGAEASVGADHIEAGSVAAIVALSGGEASLPGLRAADMRMILQVFSRLGLRLGWENGALRVPAQGTPLVSQREEELDAEIETSTWPGFPSDLVAIATLIASQAPQSTLIHERLYDNHLFFVDRLNAMGAQIVLCDPHRALVIGRQPLHGVYMDSPDIRAGLGMVGAALIARGETVLDNAEVIEQNFADALDKLTALGARIERE